MTSFRVRLALALFAIAVTAALCLAAVLLGFDEEAHETRQAERDELAFLMFVELAKDHLPAARLQELATAADRLAAGRSIESVLVTDADHRVLVSSDPARIGQFVDPSTLPSWRATTVHGPGGPEGVVAMRPARQAWWPHHLPRLLAVGGFGLLGVALVAVLVAGLLTRRLEHLARLARQSGESGPAAGDEITALGRALDELEGRLEISVAERHEREGQVRQIADELPLGMSYIDSEMRLLFVNRTLEGWLGWKRQTLLGRHLSQCMAPAHYQETLRGIEPALRGERIQRERDFAIHGEPALIATINIPDRNASGRVRGVFSLLRDVTRSRAQETERERLLAELAAKNAELERFSYTVSHDLKGPLTTIVGCADLIEQSLESGDAGQVPGDLEQIRRTAETMRKMLDELLELARVGLVANQETRIDLGQLAEDTARLLSGAIDRHGTNLEIAADLPVVLGDRQRLQRVMLNLIDNAVKFSAGVETPRVDIGCRVEDSETVIYVRDNGRGIPPEQQGRVFDLFRKLDAETEGTGIGLAIVQRIILAHKGRLWVESAGHGHGTSFCFTLPVAAKTPREGTPSAA